MENDEIILAFKGDITEDLLTSVFQIMESRLEVSPAELRLKKKVNNILVECLQNVYHHMEDFTDNEKADDHVASAMFLICQDKNNHYRIVSGSACLFKAESILIVVQIKKAMKQKRQTADKGSNKNLSLISCGCATWREVIPHNPEKIPKYGIKSSIWNRLIIQNIQSPYYQDIN